MYRLFFLLFLFKTIICAEQNIVNETQYHQFLMQKIGEKIPILSTYPALKYPNKEHQELFNKFPRSKILIFGYGSLINLDSASRTVSQEAVKTMRPTIAFGLKRIFNYKASNPAKWGRDLFDNERAMLNAEPTTTYNNMINGITMEVNKEDLIQLIKREQGYDLVPILIANWQKVMNQSKEIEMEIAYTFIVPDELRNGIHYIQTQYYPVRNYLKAIREGASRFGKNFLDYWNATTFLSDGTTSIAQWNERTFAGILDSKEP